jgi:hypothetical protein
MALREQEATRALSRWTTTSTSKVTDISGWGAGGFWVVVRDHRFERDYKIASHCDYWDFIGALVDYRQLSR